MRKPFISALAIAILLGGLVPLVAQAAVSDTSINYFVKDALRDDPRVDAAEISEATEAGVVTLSGSVEDLAAKNFAVSEAKKINGVLGVIDQIVVKPSYRLDSDIANSIRRRILNSTVINSQGIEVTCENGVVTLSGEVDSYSEEQQAGLLASEVHGVKEVKNNVITKWPSTRSDHEIKDDAVAALKRDVYLTGKPITTTVENGVVTLTGSVGNAYEKDRAYRDVRWISNVMGVDNNLTVDWYETPITREEQKAPSDIDLKATVRDALDQDSRIDASHITLRVSYGSVILDGSVSSQNERNIAERDARDVVGVAWVTNNLFTLAEKRTDWEIADDINFNLDTDYLTDGYDLNASVKDGIATLTGTVHTWYQKTHADDVASRVLGVRDVINNIAVSSTNWKKDADLVKAIRSRLKGDWSTWWVNKKINVTVKDGVATLEGDVNSWNERYKAGELAINTLGVLEVDNRLTVKGVDYPWDEHYYK